MNRECTRSSRIFWAEKGDMERLNIRAGVIKLSVETTADRIFFRTDLHSFGAKELDFLSLLDLCRLLRAEQLEMSVKLDHNTTSTFHQLRVVMDTVSRNQGIASTRVTWFVNSGDTESLEAGIYFTDRYQSVDFIISCS